MHCNVKEEISSAPSNAAPTQFQQISNIQQLRDKRKQEKQNNKMRSNTIAIEQKQGPTHRHTPSGHKLTKQRSAQEQPQLRNGKRAGTLSELVPAQDEAQLCSDTEATNNVSIECEALLCDLKWELVKGFVAHDSAVLSCHACDNVLYSTAFKMFRIWDIEAQKLITSIDLNGYVRAAHYWEDK